MLSELAAWIAPIATMIAAMMTAANLSARVTGWGFVIFTIGSVAWTSVGLASGQSNLVLANGFLTLVNIVGIWRWLGRQRAYDDGGESAKTASRRAACASLFTATGVAGMAVEDVEGASVGTAAEAPIECASGELSYVVIASGGIGGISETLRAVPREAIKFGSDRLGVAMTRSAFDGLAVLEDGDWPAQA